MHDDYDEIKQALQRIEHKLDNHLERIAKVEVRIENVSTQLKILWAILTTAIGGILTTIFLGGMHK